MTAIRLCRYPAASRRSGTISPRSWRRQKKPAAKPSSSIQRSPSWRGPGIQRRSRRRPLLRLHAVRRYGGHHIRRLRGKPLLGQKKAAIKVCGDNRLGVTLVPTIVPGVNDHNIGGIVNYAISRSPAVRGVHFQPVSYFGRYPKAPDNRDRITLPEILAAIEAQTGGKVKTDDFAASCCDHPRCGFHGDFVVLPNNMLLRLTSKSKKKTCCDGAAHLRNRNFVARRWKRPADEGAEAAGARASKAADYTDMDTFLKRIKSHGFTITAMAFQDAYTLDIERLRMCSLHVCEGGRIIPFCAKYITPFDRIV